jgi:hypothetical protein
MLPCLPLFAVHTGAWPVAGLGARAFGKFLVCRIAEDAAHCAVAASVPDKFQNLPKFLKIFLQHPDRSICDPEANRPYCTIPRFQGETFDRNLQLATHVKNLAQRKGANAMQSRVWRFSIAEEHYAAPAASPLSSLCGRWTVRSPLAHPQTRSRNRPRHPAPAARSARGENSVRVKSRGACDFGGANVSRSPHPSDFR